MKLDPLADALSNIYNYENARKPNALSLHQSLWVIS